MLMPSSVFAALCLRLLVVAAPVAAGGQLEGCAPLAVPGETGRHDWRIWAVLAAAVLAVLAAKPRASGPDIANRLLAAAQAAKAKGQSSKAYALATRSLQALGAHNQEETVETVGAVAAGAAGVAGAAASCAALQALRGRARLLRAELLLARGFAAPCAQECAAVAGPAAAALRARALGAGSEWAASAALLREAEASGPTGPTEHDRAGDLELAAGCSLARPSAGRGGLAAHAALGESHQAGAVDLLSLMRSVASVAAAAHGRLPISEGPLRFTSAKIVRAEVSGRGRGVVAAEDIDAGELLIMARPIELLCPGDPDWIRHADLERLLAARLDRRVQLDAQAAEEVFALFEGSAAYGPQWAPAPWHAEALSLPVPGGAGSSELSARVRKVVKYNAHRWPGRDPVSGSPAPGLGLWLWPPMVNHGLESDAPPNCAHVFIGDVAVYRTTMPVRRGEELLDRYSTPLADSFECTLQVLREHDMGDPVYEAAAARWGEIVLPPRSRARRVPVADAADAEPALTEGCALLAQALQAVEGALISMNLFEISKEAYSKLQTAYGLAAAEARGDTGERGELLLAPLEVRSLNLLCPLAMRWGGRAMALESRAELARRVAKARPRHFAVVKLWAELVARFAELATAGWAPTPAEAALAAEAASELASHAAFWSGAACTEEQLRDVVVPWARGAGGFHYGWFSDISTEALLSAGAGGP